MVLFWRQTATLEPFGLLHDWHLAGQKMCYIMLYYSCIVLSCIIISYDQKGLAILPTIGIQMKVRKAKLWCPATQRCFMVIVDPILMSSPTNNSMFYPRISRHIILCWCLQHATQCRGKSRVLRVLRVLQVFFWFWHGPKQVLGQGDEMLRKTLTWGNLLQLVILALNVWTCLNYSEIIRIVGVCGAGKLSWCCDPQSSGDKAAEAFNCSIKKHTVSWPNAVIEKSNFGKWWPFPRSCNTWMLLVYDYIMLHPSPTMAATPRFAWPIPLQNWLKVPR